MKHLLQDLEDLDSKENHLKTFETLLLVYLSSEDANCQAQRLDVLALSTVIRRLFL